MNRSLATLALMAVMALIGLATVAEAQSATIAQRSEKRILDCTLESKTMDDCDPQGYAMRALVFSLPGFLIAIIFLLVCPWYCCCKYCCNVCGGKYQSPNFCCPNTDLPARYSKGDIIRPKVCMLLALAMAVAALIWSMIGMTHLVGGLNDFAQSVLGVPDILTAEIQTIDDALVLEEWDTTINATKTRRLFDNEGKETKEQAEKTRDDLKKMIEDNLGDYEQMLKDFEVGLWILFIVPAALVFLGSFFGICNCRRYLPMTIVWFLFLFGILVWAAHGAFSLASMVLGDACAEVAGLANKQLNLIPVLTNCKDDMFADFKSTFKQLEITQSEKTCNQMLTLCWNPSETIFQNLAAGKVYDCPASLVCDGMTFARLVDLMETSFFIHQDISESTESVAETARCRDNNMTEFGPCTVQRCADNCAYSNGERYAIGQTSKTIYINFVGAQKVSNVIDTLGARYATCDSVMSLIVAPFDAPCQEVTKGLIYDRQASGLLGLAVIGGVFIFAWGAKRFIPLDEAEKAQREGMKEDPVEGMEA